MIGGAGRAVTIRRLPALVLLNAAGAQIAAQPRGPAAIVFPTSGSPAAHAEFLAGVAALHNFEYEDANAAFLKAQQINPGFAMAYWGEAMTYHQTLWHNEDVAVARRILLRLAPDAVARAARAAGVRPAGAADRRVRRRPSPHLTANARHSCAISTCGFAMSRPIKRRS
jgi:tetratricopeptide (TPR) repeat protein